MQMGIQVIIGECYKLGNGYAFNMMVNKKTHVVKFRTRMEAKFQIELEERMVENQTVSKNVKKFYAEDNELYIMAGSHEIGMLSY